MNFFNKNTSEIIEILKNKLLYSKEVKFKVLNPDIEENLYCGEIIYIEGLQYRYISYKSLIDLAQILKCKMLTPKDLGDIVEITFIKLNDFSFHNCSNLDKYGKESEFFKINKTQEPSFIYYYIDALKRANIYNREKILNLGINRGDEFKVIANLVDKDSLNKKEFVGVDYSKSAIEVASSSFNSSNIKFFCKDINKLEELCLGKFDMLISIGTMQSSSLSYKELLMNLVTNYLEKDSAIILGFPNSRWIGGELVYGARVPNYNFSELGLMFSDVIFAKKYLQQKKYRVTITGKDYIFLTATKIRSALV